MSRQNSNNLRYVNDNLAKGIAKTYPNKYANLILRLGGFYIADNFMEAISYVMKESGIEEILLEILW